MKIFNKLRVLAILLIGVTLIFAIMGSLQIRPAIEGFDSTVGCSGEIVPECHDTVLKFAKYDEDNMDDYVLKTEIVVPTCPACPSFEDKEWENGEWRPKYRDDEVNWDESNEYYNETTWESSKETNIVNETNINKTVALPEPVQTKTPPTTTPPPANVGLAGSATPMAAEPSSVSTPAAANNKDTPPCPACERCPEPAFECKKVPNYRSQSMQNYMPLPILNDFSKF